MFVNTLKTSLSWNAITTGFRTGLSLLRYLLIARYLSPQSFGLFTMSKGLVDSFSLLKRLGSNGSLITTDTSDAQRGSIYFIDLLLGILLYCLLFQAAPRLALWYAEPDLTHWLRLLGFSLPLLSLTDQWYILLQKEMSWRFLGLLRVAAFASGILTLVFTRNLIWESLVQYGVSVLVVAVVGLQRFPISLQFSGPDLRFSCSFGLNEMSRNIVSQLAGRISHLLLTRTFGTDVLGLLSMAQKLAFQGPARVSPIVTNLTLPALSRAHKKCSVLTQIVGLLALINVACSGFVIVVGPAIINLIFGKAWLSAAPLARILAIGAFFSALSLPFNDYLLSIHRFRSVFIVNLFSSIIHLFGVLLGCGLGSIHWLTWFAVIAHVGIVFLWIVVSVKQPTYQPQRVISHILAAIMYHGRRQIQNIRDRLKQDNLPIE